MPESCEKKLHHQHIEHLLDTNQHARLMALAYDQFLNFDYKHVPGYWRDLYVTSGLNYARQLYSEKKYIQAIETADTVLIVGCPDEEVSDLLLEIVKQSQEHLKDGKRSECTLRFATGCLPEPRLNASTRIAEYNGDFDFMADLHKFGPRPVILRKDVSEWPACSLWLKPSYWLEAAGPHRRVPVEVGEDYSKEDWGNKMYDFETFIASLCEKSVLSGKSGKKRRLRVQPSSEEAQNRKSEDGGKTVSKNINRDIENVPVHRKREETEEAEGHEASGPKLWDREVLAHDKDSEGSDSEKNTHRSDKSFGKERKREREKDLSDNALTPPLYLAQHNLFRQFDILRNDVVIPDRVYTDVNSVCPDKLPGYDPCLEPILNMWLGPGGTLSPAHTDPYYNCYCQVVGKKWVWVASPEAGKSMETHGDLLSNTARVDVTRSDTFTDAFVNSVLPFSQTAVLNPGDVLILPPKWWHSFKSLSVSASVSIWF